MRYLEGSRKGASVCRSSVRGLLSGDQKDMGGRPLGTDITP